MRRLIALLCTGGVLLALAVGCGGGGGGLPVVSELAPPAGVAVTSVERRSVEITWTDVGTGATGILVERSTDDLSNFSDVCDLSADARSYSDTALTPATTYHYRACCYTDTQRSAYTEVVSALTLPETEPVQPEELDTRRISPSTILITWADRSDNEAGFRIFRSEDGGQMARKRDTPANLQMYRDFGLDPRKEYSYQVRAFNDVGDSGLARTRTGEDTASARTMQPVTYAYEVSVPATSTSGNYDVTITQKGTFGVSQHTLTEATNPAFTQNLQTYMLYTGDITFTKSFVDKEARTYFYKVGDSNVVAITVASTRATSVELTVFPDDDNCILMANWEEWADPPMSSFESMVFPGGDLPVGTNYSVGYEFDCYTRCGSLLLFDLSAIPSNALISSAELRLAVEVPPALALGSYHCYPFGSEWDPTTVCWNTAPKYWKDEYVTPSYTSNTAWTFDTTSIVQNWVNTTWENHGFLLYDPYIITPPYSQLQAVFFHSLETAFSSGPEYLPRLVITYKP